MTTDDDRPQWTRFTKWGFYISGTVAVASSLTVIVASLIHYFWGTGRRPTPTVEAITVGFFVFVIFNIVMMAWTTFGHPRGRRTPPTEEASRLVPLAWQFAHGHPQRCHHRPDHLALAPLDRTHRSPAPSVGVGLFVFPGPFPIGKS
jgi:hypothetical protein